MDPESFTYLHSVLIGHHVGVGDYQSILGNDKTRTTGDSYLPLRKYHPKEKGIETIKNSLKNM